MELNAGHEIVERIANEIAAVDLYDFVIVGVGAPGLSAAIRAQDFSLRAVVLEANYVAETVYTMTKGKVLFTGSAYGAAQGFDVVRGVC